MLEQLVAGVDPPARRRRRRQHRADLERGRAAVLQERVEDVGGVDEEVGPHQVVALAGELAEVVLDLAAGGAPREVRVGLVEPDRPQPVHHRRPGERLGEEDHVGVGRADLAQQPLPERDRLGVGVVDAEDPDAVRHPVADDPQHLGGDAGRVVVEVDGVDVLVLLGRVLGVRDGAVGAGGEPLRVAGDPRVVRGALQGEVERDLQPQLGGPLDEGVEVVDRPEVGVDGVVAAVLAADRPGGAGVVRLGREGVVGALAVDLADRVDRRQVDHVEAHRGHGVEPLGGGGEGAAGRPPGARVERRALRAGEELVPAAEERPRPVGVRGERAPRRSPARAAGAVGGPR